MAFYIIIINFHVIYQIQSNLMKAHYRQFNDMNYIQLYLIASVLRFIYNGVTGITSMSITFLCVLLHMFEHLLTHDT